MLNLVLNLCKTRKNGTRTMSIDFVMLIDVLVSWLLALSTFILSFFHKLWTYVCRIFDKFKGNNESTATFVNWSLLLTLNTLSILTSVFVVNFLCFERFSTSCWCLVWITIFAGVKSWLERGSIQNVNYTIL